MKKYSRIFKLLTIAQFAFMAMQVSATEKLDPRYTGELHPPIMISEKNKKTVILFLKNNLKDEIKTAHVANGEIYYLQVQPIIPELNYVWKVEGDQISSVFFYEWTSPERAGKSMYLLTKTMISNNLFEGVSYSVTEFPILLEGEKLSLNFFPGDIQDSKLQNCHDGVNLKDNTSIICPYKTAHSIKKYLESQDKQ